MVSRFLLKAFVIEMRNFVCQCSQVWRERVHLSIRGYPFWCNLLRNVYLFMLILLPGGITVEAFVWGSVDGVIQAPIYRWHWSKELLDELMDPIVESGHHLDTKLLYLLFGD